MSHTKTLPALRRVLANTYVLYLRTHGYHWNVEGPNFKPLHELFEENYRALWESLDDLAERIRALGELAPMGGAALTEAATLTDKDNDVPDAEGMLRRLIAGHDGWLEAARAAYETAGDEGDPGTEGLLGELITAHEKMRWMLAASLPK
jgi:starvation-inducible DNA-binding protein